MEMMRDNDVIVVIFSKEQVRRCKLAHFLKQFGRDALPQGPALAALMNRFRFLVHGYDDDPQELYAIVVGAEWCFARSIARVRRRGATLECRRGSGDCDFSPTGR